jgi:tetratricopeptide (TPR) repeat protein
MSMVQGTIAVGRTEARRDAARETWSAGRLVGGKYVLLGRLGEGGVGMVFEAQNTWTTRYVAVKVLRPECAESPDAVRRFRREARTTTQLRHPNIVDVLDMGQDADGTLYIVEELLHGMRQRDLLEEKRRLSPAEALDVLVPVMGALEAAHERGVLHRDLKPENVFLCRGEDGVIAPKVIDFGISKVIAAAGPPAAQMDGGSTVAGGIVGTPEYMSPEQIVGEELDARSDVWAAGVVWFEALSGRRPFTGEIPLAIFRQIVRGPAPAFDPEDGVPADLAAAVLRALARDRDGRHPTMRAFLAALRACALPSGPPSLRSAAVAAVLEADRPRITYALCDTPFADDDSGELLVSRKALPTISEVTGAGTAAGGTGAVRRAEVCILRAEHALGTNALERALDWAQRGARHASRAQIGRLHLVEAIASNWLGRPEQAERAAEDAMGALPPASAPWFAAAEEAASASRCLGRTDRLVAVAEELMDRLVDAPFAIAAALRVALQLLRAGEPPRAAWVLAAVRARVEELAPREPVVRARWNEVRAFMGQRAGDPSADVKLYTEAAQAFAEAGDARSACTMRGNVAEAYRMLGAFQRAAGAFREALAVAAPMGLWVASVLKANLALVLAQLGETEEAIHHVSMAIAELAVQGNRPAEARARTYRAQILLGAGDAAGAESEARAAAELAAELPPERSLALATLARAELSSGRRQEALAHASAAKGILRDLGGLEEGEVQVRLAHILAIIAAGRPRDVVAKHALRATGRLITRANQIRDLAFRESFLTAVEENAALRAVADDQLGSDETWD